MLCDTTDTGQNYKGRSSSREQPARVWPASLRPKPEPAGGLPRPRADDSGSAGSNTSTTLHESFGRTVHDGRHAHTPTGVRRPATWTHASAFDYFPRPSGSTCVDHAVPIAARHTACRARSRYTFLQRTKDETIAQLRLQSSDWFRSSSTTRSRTERGLSVINRLT